MNKGHGKPATKERPGPYDRPQVQKEIRLQELTDKMQCLCVKGLHLRNAVSELRNELDGRPENRRSSYMQPNTSNSLEPQEKHQDPEKTPEVDIAKQLNETTSSPRPVSGNWCPRHYEAGQKAGPHLKGEAMSCGCCAGTCDICSVE